MSKGRGRARGGRRGQDFEGVRTLSAGARQARCRRVPAIVEQPHQHLGRIVRPTEYGAQRPRLAPWSGGGGIVGIGSWRWRGVRGHWRTADGRSSESARRRGQRRGRVSKPWVISIRSVSAGLLVGGLRSCFPPPRRPGEFAVVGPRSVPGSDVRQPGFDLVSLGQRLLRGRYDRAAEPSRRALGDDRPWRVLGRTGAAVLRGHVVERRDVPVDDRMLRGRLERGRVPDPLGPVP